MKKTSTKVKQGRGPTQYPGITEDAHRLGVNRSTLWRALTLPGYLPKLARRYHTFKKGAGK